MRGVFMNNIEKYYENTQSDKTTARGNPKHWHIFNVIAKKQMHTGGEGMEFLFENSVPFLKKSKYHKCKKKNKTISKKCI